MVARSKRVGRPKACAISAPLWSSTTTRRFGCAIAASVPADETIEVPSVGGREPRVLSRQILAEVIETVAELVERLIGHVAEDGGKDEQELLVVR